MKTVALIVILGLVATSSAAFYKKGKPFKVDASSIESTEKKQTMTFGDLASFFQTHDFRVNDQLTGFLDGLTAQIQQEHNDHVALYEEQREECADEFEFRGKEIADAEDSLARSQSHLGLCSAERTRAQNLEDLAAQSLVEFNNQLDTLRERRAAQIADYNQKSASLSNVGEQIQVALNLLDEFEMVYNGDVPASFVQMMNSLLALTVKTGHSHKILPVYNKLIQSHAKGSFDISDIQELRDRLSSLLTTSQQSSQALDAAEADNAAAFESTEAYILDVIARLTKQVNDSVEYVSLMDTCVGQEESISLEAQGKIDRNQGLLDQARALCADADAEFQQGEANRRGQLELLSQLSTAVDALETEFGESLLPNIADIVDLS